MKSVRRNTEAKDEVPHFGLISARFEQHNHFLTDSIPKKTDFSINSVAPKMTEDALINLLDSRGRKTKNSTGSNTETLTVPFPLEAGGIFSHPFNKQFVLCAVNTS